MSDLISRQAAMDEMSKQQTYKMFAGEDTLYLDANDVGSVLASLPSAQPEIVRCGECKYCRKVDEYEYWCYGFCSPARLVRKEISAHMDANMNVNINKCESCVYYQPRMSYCELYLRGEEICTHCRGKNEEMQEVANKDAFYGAVLND